jgi:hypothetical protein
MNPVQSNPDGSGEDAEQMRLAFEAFMLKGKGAATTSESGDTSTNTSITTSTTNKTKKPERITSSPSPNKLDQSTKKRYYQLLKSFSNKVQQSWFEVDDQMLAVMESIVSIRGRIPSEWKMLSSYDNNRMSCKEKVMNGQAWKCHGYRGKTELRRPMHLYRSDVQLALDNDLEQHEKMVGALRSLISELSETHDSLGRLVDTIWAFHLECQQDRIEDENENEEQSEIHMFVQNASDLYQTLSTELYRKQCLIPKVIATINDEMLGSEFDPTSSENFPLKVARDSYKSWARRIWARRIDPDTLRWILRLSSQ